MLLLSTQFLHLVNLNSGINFSNEEECRVKTNGSRQQPESNDHHQRVCKVQESRNEFFNVEFGVEVEDAVREHVER